MAAERCGGKNLNIQSIVSAIINNLHSLPNSVNSNGCGNRFENADVELRNGFSIPRNSEQPTRGPLSNNAVIPSTTITLKVTFHGSKIMAMPGPNKEKEGNNHDRRDDRRPMVGLKGKGAIDFASAFDFDFGPIGMVVYSG